MNEQFVPYQLALELKKLGFNEYCLAFWTTNPKFTGDKIQLCMNYCKYGYSPAFASMNNETLELEIETLAPLWQQAFDWFRTKYGLSSYIRSINSDSNYSTAYWKIDVLNESEKVKGYSNFSNNYDEAKLACLEELIKIVKEKAKLNATTLVVREAMKFVSKDVIAPKVVREGIVKIKNKKYV